MDYYDEQDFTTESKACGIEGCRSRKYRITDQGIKECSNGHNHGRAATDINDEDDFQSRNLGVKYRKEKEVREKVLRQYTGKFAYSQFLLCYQYVLKAQIKFLVEKKAFPKPIESIVKDLWTLRLANLPSHRKPTSEERLRSMNNDSDEQDGELSDQRSGPAFSSLPDDESEEARTQNAPAVSSWGVSISSTPSMLQSVAMLYIASQMLFIPVTLGDFLLWVELEELHYTRVIKVIPRSLRDRLPAVWQAALNPKIDMNAEHLLNAVKGLAVLFTNILGISFSPVNLPLHLWRMIHELALPLEVYHAVQSAAQYVAFDFTYPKGDANHLKIIDFPEGQLVACVVVVIKLFYGFDGIRRTIGPKDTSGCAMINWSEWQKAHLATDRMTSRQAKDVTDHDVLDMSNQEIDDYMDYFNRQWTRDEPRRTDKDYDYMTAIYKLFPYHARNEEDDLEPSKEYSGSEVSIDLDGLSDDSNDSITADIDIIDEFSNVYETNEANIGEDEHGSEDVILLPADGYVHYRSADEMRGFVLDFHQRVADYSGLPLKVVIRAVVHMENLMMNLNKAAVKIKRSRGRPRKDTSNTQTAEAKPRMENAITESSSKTSRKGPRKKTLKSEASQEDEQRQVEDNSDRTRTTKVSRGDQRKAIPKPGRMEGIESAENRDRAAPSAEIKRLHERGRGEARKAKQVKERVKMEVDDESQ